MKTSPKQQTSQTAGSRADDVQDEQTLSCTLAIGGMDCASCGETVERALKHLPGVLDAQADVMGGRVRIELRPELSPESLGQTLARSGYPVQSVVRASSGFRWIEMPKDAPTPPWWRTHAQLLYTVLAAVFWTAALLASFVWKVESAVIVFSVLAVIAGGRFVFPAGLRALRLGKLDMNFLMSAAAIGALIIGEYVEGASVLFLYSVAEYLEARSMDRARSAVKKLMELSPPEASLRVDGGEQRVPVESLEIGDVVIVRPGERIPVDGRIVRGASFVNQAAITGESLPLAKAQEDEVFAGTLNGDGALEISVQKLAEDTTLARIMHSIEEAQASRSQTQRFVDRFASAYTPAIVALTILIAIVPPLVLGGDWHTWIYRALVLLVVSCPCALVIATPVTMVSALGGAAKAGVLVKGGVHLESASRLRHLAFDKTGTLTTGKLVVDAVIPLGALEERELLRYAAIAERESEHPLAAAILALAEARGLDLQDVNILQTQAYVGRGLKTTIAGEDLYAGNPRLLKELCLWTEEGDAILAREEARGASVIFIAAQSHDSASARMLGAIALNDTLRTEAVEALRELRSLGVETISMLTGDSDASAQGIAAQLAAAGQPLDVVGAGLLPEDKVHALKRLRAEKEGGVAMVGDGVNDAPALAAADLGIAMGTSGTDVALETADVALMGDDLRRIGLLLRYATRAQGVLRWNIGVALGLKLLFIVLATTGYATLWMAVLADTGATLLVVANGLRAMWVPGTDRSRLLKREDAIDAMV